MLSKNNCNTFETHTSCSSSCSVSENNQTRLSSDMSARLTTPLFVFLPLLPILDLNRYEQLTLPFFPICLFLSQHLAFSINLDLSHSALACEGVNMPIVAKTISRSRLAEVNNLTQTHHWCNWISNFYICNSHYKWCQSTSTAWCMKKIHSQCIEYIVLSIFYTQRNTLKTGANSYSIL